MENVGVISEEEWSSLNGMCSEEAAFMVQLLGNCSLPNEVPGDTNFPVSKAAAAASVSVFWPAHFSNGNIAGVDESAMCYSSDDTDNNTNMYSFSQGSSYSGGSSIAFPITGDECYCPPGVYHQVFMANNNLTVIDKNNSWLVHILGAHAMGGDDFLNQEVSNDSVTEFEDSMSEDFLHGKSVKRGRGLAMPTPKEGKVISSSHSESKKRCRVPEGVQRNKRGVKLNKCPRVDDSYEDNNSNSNSCCREDDSNVSHEFNGKTRANRGSATDPQSLYARKRRERINERLRILQNLVPNGTKVDISTMLEEAVQYVKFLQLQIKLLSSEELWMYAPIAYNGMDIGLDLKISTPKPQS